MNEEKKNKVVETVIRWRLKNPERWKAYHAKKQKAYRDIKRGKPPHHLPTFVKYTRAEEVFIASGHCSYCGMLLSSEYHKKHPLVGCQKAAKRVDSSKKNK
jgi:hypothetical protein